MPGIPEGPDLVGSARAGPARELFRRLVIADPEAVAALTRHSRGPRLDDRSEALVRIASLVALDAPDSAYAREVDAARLTGVELDDLLRILVAVADTVGSARVLAAAPKLAGAAGYDAEAALELMDPSDHATGA